MSSADVSWVSIWVMYLRSCTQGASLAPSISHGRMVTTARARSWAIFATMRYKEPRGAWMYSRSQRSLLQPHFHPLSYLVETLEHFRGAVLPYRST